MGDDNDQSEEISSNILLVAILDIQKNLDKYTAVSSRSPTA